MFETLTTLENNILFGRMVQSFRKVGKLTNYLKRVDDEKYVNETNELDDLSMDILDIMLSLNSVV